MLENKERNNVILRDLDREENIYLSLTSDQIRFFNWLCDKGVVDENYYELETVEKTINWIEV